VNAAMQVAGVLLGIVVLLALNALLFYVIYRIGMLIIGVIPLTGGKHKHRDWDRLNRGG
jgi:hypothetical protein